MCIPISINDWIPKSKIYGFYSNTDVWRLQDQCTLMPVWGVEGVFACVYVGVSMFVCACMCYCVLMCVCVCMYMYASMWVFGCVCKGVYVCMYVCMYVGGGGGMVVSVCLCVIYGWLGTHIWVEVEGRGMYVSVDSNESLNG